MGWQRVIAGTDSQQLRLKTPHAFLAGMVTVPGLLPPGSKMIDTPGVPHPFQLASLLTADEVGPAGITLPCWGMGC